MPEPIKVIFALKFGEGKYMTKSMELAESEGWFEAKEGERIEWELRTFLYAMTIQTLAHLYCYTEKMSAHEAGEKAHKNATAMFTNSDKLPTGIIYTLVPTKEIG